MEARRARHHRHGAPARCATWGWGRPASKMSARTNQARRRRRRKRPGLQTGLQNGGRPTRPLSARKLWRAFAPDREKKERDIKFFERGRVNHVSISEERDPPSPRRHGQNYTGDESREPITPRAGRVRGVEQRGRRGGGRGERGGGRRTASTAGKARCRQEKHFGISELIAAGVPTPPTPPPPRGRRRCVLMRSS